MCRKSRLIVISYQLSNILAIFFINNHGFGKIDIAILVIGAPTKIIVTAVHGARTAFALNVLMAIS